ncbi:hypothetical protein C1645_588186 [Glomus cerebriforme]|uniref:Concanavalin A-like lectin/glucanase domain-containing protein n=1 Tax=Glomus cerebriforme TaxID=658196 RepID=A0A397TL39_9GLOM|nr:hypothetical protein C1645_588186 [Glomus cerebriforme]
MSQDSFSQGESLEIDFKRLINDKRFHDISLKCSDEITVFGCKAILATRSKIFNDLIFTRSNNDILLFNNINSNSMKVILEYLYTSKIEKENLTVKNFIGVYHASIHFNLMSLQNHIIDRTMEFLMNIKYRNPGKRLLSECVNKFSFNVDNEISQILVDWVAKDKLEKNDIDALSLEGLKYLLMKTINSKKPFATPEFEIWEYVLMKAINEFEGGMILEPHREIKEIRKCLTPFTHYIDLNRMDAKEIEQYIEPYNVFSVKKVKNVYRSKALGEGLEFIRGVPIFKWKYDVNLKVSNGGFTIETKKIMSSKSIFGDLIFKGQGVYEWNILIEKLYKTVYIGICDINENLKKKDRNYHGWVLGSDGYVYHKDEWKWYDAKYKEGDKVTVHLDMKNKTCAFSINKNKKPIVSEWKNISSEVYPIVSMEYGSKLRVEPCIIPHCLEIFYN